MLGAGGYVVSKLAKDESKVQDRRAGLGRLLSGQVYVHGWPADKKPVVCDESIRQTLQEAASWCERAVGMAKEHAASFGGHAAASGRPSSELHLLFHRVTWIF